ncbi:iron(III) transport system ATP-binding protein [Symbiobacterium terraclitae]|uniref:Iron(III) transport system ATP-binding protein n=1 Tax=Symbiobacterium terraclitae TaxID=557451 RepID=A0ABS4JRQ0_9FIRM|nr:ABC transporter ATP-binding protein [Symbiobacterium terraclitae]MBP2018212.1 iron(III) transport system ATP-binding protein [Symbiobacterium terraclitae]
MSKVTIEGVVKRFEGHAAVAGVSLTVESGELFTLLGPSGCGKTTLLRVLAGFYQQDEGNVRFGDRLVNDVPAHKRNTGMVFQNYAVFPHMTVFENVAYGLKARKVGGQELQRRVTEALEMVKLADLKDRMPSQLSGGQQQRVALARALVIQPQLLLMDEPLSNLDAKLRIEMRTEIRRLQRQYGITTIYVTHDQEEALAISDRIAVMNQGRVEQVGSPRDIYFNPQTLFVAGFIGTTNLLPARVQGGEVRVLDQALREVKAADGDCTVTIRPEKIALGQGEISFTGHVEEALFVGSGTTVFVRTPSGQRIEVRLPNEVEPPRVGEQATFGFRRAAAAVYGAQGEVLA